MAQRILHALVTTTMLAGCAAALGAPPGSVEELAPGPVAVGDAVYDLDGTPIGDHAALAPGQAAPVEPVGDATRRLGPEPPPPSPTHPRRVGRRNIRLYQASLDNALRLLAEAGGIDLVMQGELKTPVSVELRGVEPFDAMQALADAHGLSLTYRGGIVIVTQGARPLPPGGPLPAGG